MLGTISASVGALPWGHVGTSKPLKIVVDPRIWGPWCEELETQGHHVIPAEWAEDCDLLLGPTCARFLPGMHVFLDSFIKGAWAIKYPGTKKEKG